jgi:hypothetical protein
VKPRVAGVGSAFPAESRANTENVCAPAGSVPVLYGDPQAIAGPSSSRQVNVESGSEDVKLNVGAESVVSPLGPPVIAVCGGLVSGMESKAACTVWLSLIVTVQGPIPEQSPLQPAKLDPGAGVALSVTTVPDP